MPEKVTKITVRQDTDSYALDDGTDYSREKFYTGSKDDSKDSISITVNVPRGLWTEVDQWVQGAKVGAYRTRQDFVRDALFHRAHDIKSILRDPDLTQSLVSLLGTAEQQRRKAQMEERRAFIKEAEETMAMARADRDMDNLKRSIDDAETRVEAWPECGARADLADLIDRYRRHLD